MTNGGILNPDDSILIVSAKVSDITVITDNDDGWVTIVVENFKDGIEIVHDKDDLWWPV